MRSSRKSQVGAAPFPVSASSEMSFSPWIHVFNLLQSTFLVIFFSLGKNPECFSSQLSVSVCVCVYTGGEQPIPLWNEHDLSTDGDKPKILLYSLNLTFKVETR